MLYLSLFLALFLLLVPSNLGLTQDNHMECVDLFNNVWIKRHPKMCPLIVRAAFHDAGTWNKDDPHSGAQGCLLQTCTGFKECSDDDKGLHIFTVPFVQFYDEYNLHAKITPSDLMYLFATECIRYSSDGGCVPEFRWGRPNCVSPKRHDVLPKADEQRHKLVDIMGKLGFNAKGIITLLGAHTLGQAHNQNSGRHGSWVDDPLKFDNSYYVDLLQKVFEKKFGNDVHSKPQWEDNDGKNMMIDVDIAIGWDIKNGCHKIGRDAVGEGRCPLNFPPFRHIIDYGANGTLFFHDFEHEFGKLISLLPHGYKLYKPCFACENPEEYIAGNGFPGEANSPVGFSREELEDSYHNLTYPNPYNGNLDITGSVHAPFELFPTFFQVQPITDMPTNRNNVAFKRNFLEIIEQAIVTCWNGMDRGSSTGEWNGMEVTILLRKTLFTLHHYPAYKYQQFGFGEYTLFLDREVTAGLEPHITILENFICQEMPKQKNQELDPFVSIDWDLTRSAQCQYSIRQISIKHGHTIGLATVRDQWSVTYGGHDSAYDSLPKLVLRDITCEFYTRSYLARGIYNECLLPGGY